MFPRHQNHYLDQLRLKKIRDASASRAFFGGLLFQILMLTSFGSAKSLINCHRHTFWNVPRWGRGLKPQCRAMSQSAQQKLEESNDDQWQHGRTNWTHIQIDNKISPSWVSIAVEKIRLRVFWRRLDEDSGQASIEEFGSPPWSKLYFDIFWVNPVSDSVDCSGASCTKLSSASGQSLRKAGQSKPTKQLWV